MAEEEKGDELRLDDELVRNDIQQQFHNDGMIESTNTRANDVVVAIKKVLEEHKITVMINRSLKSECQEEQLFFQGEEIGIRFIIVPVDKFGNDGKVWLKEEEYDALKKRVEEGNVK